MLNNKKIDYLRQKYKISDKELEDLGLIKTDTEILSSRLTTEEHEKIIKLCFDKDWYASEVIRRYIIDSINKKKINIKEIKKLKKNKINTNDTAHITLRLERDFAIQFKELCKKNYVSVSAAIRCIVIKICNKEGKIDK